MKESTTAFSSRSESYTKLKLKMYQIWDGFCAVAKLNGGRRSSATLSINAHDQNRFNERFFFIILTTSIYPLSFQNKR